MKYWYRILDGVVAENEVPVLYGEEYAVSVMDDGNEIKFDIDLFGSIFFLITLYEEINASETDEFDRFDYRQSFLFKENLINRPIANEYKSLWLPKGKNIITVGNRLYMMSETQVPTPGSENEK